MLLYLHRLIKDQILSLPLKFQVILSINIEVATFSVRHVKKCEHNSNARALGRRDYLRPLLFHDSSLIAA